MKRVIVFCIFCFTYPNLYADEIDPVKLKVFKFVKSLACAIDVECKEKQKIEKAEKEKVEKESGEKESGEKSKKKVIWYSDALAAVLLAIGKSPKDELSGSEPSEKLSDLQFFLENSHHLAEFVSSTVSRIDPSMSDPELNAALFSGKVFNDLNKMFPKDLLFDESPVKFSGEVVIRSSQGGEIEEGTPVNVSFTLDEQSAKDVTLAAVTAIDSSAELKARDLVVGRLTGTANKKERHVSLALRILWSKGLADYVKTLNEGKLEGKTKGKLELVVPPDIRTELSLLSLVSDETDGKFKDIKQKIKTYSPEEGNILPQFHITQANKPINSNKENLEEFLQNPTRLKTIKEFLLERKVEFR